MALQNYFTNYTPAEDGSGVPEEWAIRGHGVRKAYIQNTCALLAADNAGSTYSIIKAIPSDVILSSLLAEVDAMSGLTQASVGLYNSLTGAVKVIGCYTSAADWHTGSTKLSPFDALAALTHEQTMQPVYLLAGDTLLTKPGTYDLVFTAVTAPVQAGSVTFRGEIIPNG